MKRSTKALVAALLLLGGLRGVDASRLVTASPLDRDILMLRFLDGEVVAKDDGLGATAFTSEHTGDDLVVRYGAALNTTSASTTSSWTLRSDDDASYGTTGRSPTAVHRKSKLNGMAETTWGAGDWNYEFTMEHTLFLRLPSPLQQGKRYRLAIAAGTNSDSTSRSFVFDVFQTVSEAVHVNLVGYAPASPVKAADLYLWMGDGGARDYKGFEGAKVWLRNVATGNDLEVGSVAFWKARATEAQSYDLTASPVWNVDFPRATDTGTYRLVVEGVGASQDFRISPSVYREPFQVGVKGFYYMRIGQDSTAGIRPVPRRPLWIPGVSPPSTKVVLTTLHPYHADWATFSSTGDPWDKKDEWAAYAKAGSPTNPRARGGHSDALDWDRHLGHVSIVHDMLLPYLLTNGAAGDDDVGIAESGNGIPDLLDEARNEIDFWLNLRDGEGYSHGLNNPNGSNVFYQAGTTAVAAWANAANAAMLGEAFRIAGQPVLSGRYRDSARAAWIHASSLADPQLSRSQDVGDGQMRGRDFKATAAAFLFNLTGETVYEDALNAESVCASSATADLSSGSVNQLHAAVGYLLSPRTRRYPNLLANMKSSVDHQARTKNVAFSQVRPSRRATDDRSGYFHTIQNVHHALIAHAVATSPADRALFRKALELEADWGLGRNPTNLIQMTTAATSLASKRSVEGAYTSGRDDGTPGLHPGHTPYMNMDDWAPGMVMGRPSWMSDKGYPSFAQWPKVEGYFNSRYVWSNGEFTPQQTMRGKMALYAYLHGLGRSEGSTSVPNRPHLRAAKEIRWNASAREVAFQSRNPGTFTLEFRSLSGAIAWSESRRLEGGSTTAWKVPLEGSGIGVVSITGPGFQACEVVLVP
jgi:endoglucanase